MKYPYRILRVLVLVLACWVYVAAYASPHAFAQDLSSIWNIYSPFVWIPVVKGEVQARVTWVNLVRGKNEIAGVGNLDLRDDFFLSSSNGFLDLMGGIYIGRFGARLCYSPRDFAVHRASRLLPGFPRSGARFSYSVLRVGGDVDLVRWNESRLGFNIDYDLDQPIWTEGMFTLGGNRIKGNPALTCGFHLVYNPLVNVCGVSGIVETRARWPVSGTAVTDWEVGAGVLAPTTILGTMGLMGGYRQTTVDFKGTQQLNNVEVDSRVDVTMGGWFGELIYFY